MADEQKPAASQTGPAGQPQKGVQIRTMKSDIEALQKKPGVAPSPALKPALPVPPAPPVAPAIKPPIAPITPPIMKPPIVPAPISSIPAALRPSVPTPPVISKSVIPPPPVGGPAVPVIPPSPAEALAKAGVKPALPPITPVAAPRPVPPVGIPAAGIPPFRPAVPPLSAEIPLSGTKAGALVVPPIPARPAASVPPLSAMPAAIPAVEEEGGRERIMFLVKRIALFGGLAVAIGGIAGIIIYYLVPPAAPLAPKTPAALFSVGDVKIIDLGQEPEKVLTEEIRTLGAKPLGSEKSFTQVLFKTETKKCFTLKRNCVVESRYLEPKEIYGILGAAVPPYLSGLTNDNFTLFVYNQEGSPRFGAVILSSDSEAVFADISAKESGLAGYWELLTGAAIPSPEGYKDSVYQNINIRYLNLPDPYLAVDYASYPARNYLLFATSRESIFALIDRLFGMEGK